MGNRSSDESWYHKKMIIAYSQRLLPPYSSVVQVVESPRAQAQSFDGISWEILYLSGIQQTDEHKPGIRGYGNGRGYFRVANWQGKELKTYIFPACVDHAQVAESIDELAQFLATAKVPFPVADEYEYWLLDGADESPLALLFSCCDESQMAAFPGRTEWTALPHSKMKIANTEGEQARNEAPVNHRFQRLIANRAGDKPQAAWFKRDADEAQDFPGLLVREDWGSAVEQDICQRYLMRKAPRLLMLQGLSFDDRERLEIASKQYALEVDGYFPLYPEVNDQQRMNALRVEAQLRRTTSRMPKADKPETPASKAPMGKDMRIFET